MSERINYYDVLGVSPTASSEEIKAAYRKMARQYHPDLARSPGAKEQMQTINEAYRILSNIVSRRKYDQEKPVEQQDTSWTSSGNAQNDFMSVLHSFQTPKRSK